MTPRKTEIQKVLRNCQAIEKKLDECTQLYRQCADILAALASGTAPNTNGLTGPPTGTSVMETAILTALSSCAAVGVHSVPRPWLAVIARLSPKSSPYYSALGKLTKEHLIRRSGVGCVSLTEKMRGAIAPEPMPLDLAELLRRVATLFRQQESALLNTLANHAKDTGEEWMSRQDLAEKAGQSFESSSFRERLTQLREEGFVFFGPNSTVSVTLQWFHPQASA